LGALRTRNTHSRPLFPRATDGTLSHSESRRRSTQNSAQRAHLLSHYYNNNKSNTGHHQSQYQALPKDKFFPNAVAGATFTAININTPQYLLYLFSRFQAAGGKVVRATLQSIDQVIIPDAPLYSSPASLSVGTGPKPARVDAVIVCLGLGARKLVGVDDANLYPIRGQTVVLRAPWVRSGISLSNGGGTFSYVIPRGSGEVRV